MEFIVCNRCGCHRGKKQFFITACSHVFCETCRVTPTTDYCHLCKIPTKSLKMDGNLPKNVRKMFCDIGTINADINKRLTKIIGFQKFQKSMQLKVECKKSMMRKEQITRMEKMSLEYSSQLSKLATFEESNRKKLEETTRDNEKLKNLVKALELELSSHPPLNENDDDDFFIKGTPTYSDPSADNSFNANDGMFEFDLLGLKNRSDSSTSSCSSQSNREGSLF